MKISIILSLLVTGLYSYCKGLIWLCAMLPGPGQQGAQMDVQVPVGPA